MIVLIIILLIIIYYFMNNNEHFTEIEESQYIDYNVIHLKNLNDKKKKNILNNEKKLNKKINIFDAIIGKNIDIDKLNIYDKNIKLNYEFKTKSELGCYLSHLMLIKKAINSNKKYTVIFEDDFTILSNDLNKDILEITKKVNDNFDIIYLGNLYESKSEQVIDNIYKKSNIIQLLGTHALLINNKNAQKIYKNLLNINKPIDNLMEQLINENKLNSYVIYPSLVIQNNNYESTLRPSYDILKRDIIQQIIKFFNKITD
jgi:GR25 family glycosyltransferase involved in LPS biosynthesis